MTEDKLIPVLRKESDASRLLLPRTSKYTHPVVVLEVRAGDRYHASLGSFSSSNPPKGFSLEITPNNDPETVVPQLTRLGATYDEYELLLHVANHSDRSVCVEVQQQL